MDSQSIHGPPNHVNVHSDLIHSPGHPLANHVNVHLNLMRFPEHPWANHANVHSDFTYFPEHPWADHVNVHLVFSHFPEHPWANDGNVHQDLMHCPEHHGGQPCSGPLKNLLHFGLDFLSFFQHIWGRSVADAPSPRTRTGDTAASLNAS